MIDLNALSKLNATRWRQAEIIRYAEFVSVAKRLVVGKPRYLSVQTATGVPWWFVAVAHEREASGRWDKQLGQGDPLNQVSTRDPRGRGPFKTWEASAIDALVNCGPHAARNKDWSVGGALTMLEQYNGLGYAMKARPSPYVWSGTNQYMSGKYIADHVYDPNVIDKQLGCAGLILAMMKLDPSIQFGDQTLSVTPTASTIVNKPKTTANATQQVTAAKSFWAALRALFTKKV